MRKLSSIVMAVVLALLPLAGTPVMAQGQNPPSNQSFVAGRFVARNYIYPGISISGGGGAANTTYSIQLSAGSIRLSDGRTIVPFSAGGINTQGLPGSFPAIPISVGAGTVQETVTPTAVSGCYIGAPRNSCTITAAFTQAHGIGEVVTSGSDGIQEAINDSAYMGGGTVLVDSSISLQFGGDSAVRKLIAAAVVFPQVSIEDNLEGPTQYWNPQGGATSLAAPATLTAVTALPSATPVGAFGTGTYHLLIACVDAMGQEGQSSADFSEAGLATGSFIFSPPAAQTGCVGYVPFIGLTGGGSATIVYKVPLVTQPTVLGNYPVSNGVCVLTTVEITTPACAVTNATYGQVGSTATVSVITLNTSPLAPQLSIVSTTSVTIPNAGGRTTYSYVPGSHIGTPGLVAGYTAFAVSGSAATTVPTVLGTINIEPGFMNAVGREIEICGRAGITTGSTSTIVSISFQWDSMGQDTAGLGVTIGSLGLTPVAAFSTTEMDNFCEIFQTTVASASATGGSINTAGGYMVTSGVATAAAGQGAGGDAKTGATGSLNLADDARINVVYTHTTGTFAPTLQNLSVKVIN